MAEFAPSHRVHIDFCSMVPRGGPQADDPTLETSSQPSPGGPPVSRSKHLPRGDGSESEKRALRRTNAADSDVDVMRKPKSLGPISRTVYGHTLPQQCRQRIGLPVELDQVFRSTNVRQGRTSGGKE
ncbi:beta-N-acetylhexosaminidase [Anopheles sinensis]|uniref:Beta-N-acetylhexosaminidase n=1 Tax=Anopheles sinensis TaxID=74873 RepID=A0A084W5G5_ANOSI|nr:beta-N-acetylhexosaminidase [Anopheles sinensis]